MGSKHYNTNGRSVWSIRGTMWKINLIWSFNMRVSWSAYELFTRPWYTIINWITITRKFSKHCMWHTEPLDSCISPILLGWRSCDLPHWRSNWHFHMSSGSVCCAQCLLNFLFRVIQCPWCTGYRRRKWTRRFEFKSWTRLIAFHIALIPLGRYESNYSPSSYG